MSFVLVEAPYNFHRPLGLLASQLSWLCSPGLELELRDV